MPSKSKLGPGRRDKFYALAKEQGFRSRAAFKLIQLNRKYDFLSGCKALLDLCAAPGGWLQVAAKAMPLTSLIIGVDLVPIKPVRGVKTLVHDITTQACRTALKKEVKGGKFDVVLHDGAPNIGGAWSNEAYTQSALVLDSLRLATESLVPGGWFVTKVFRSKDYNALLYAFNQLFTKVESTKPTASRNTSAEIFVVCQGYKAPAKIDPRMLDPKHLFQEVSEVKKTGGPDALLREKVKQKRHREGYEEGLTNTHRLASALAFVASGPPVEMLGQYTRFSLDGPESWKAEGFGSEAKELAESIRSHKATTSEIRSLCLDLQVLGRSEFKQLLKWRLAVRKALGSELPAIEDERGTKAKSSKKVEKGSEGENKEELDPEEALLSEMASVQSKMEARLKREKKNRREMKKKAKIRALQMISSQGIATGEDDLFTLSSIKGPATDGKASSKLGSKGLLSTVAEVSAPGERDMEILEADSDDDGPDSEGSEIDSDEEALRYEMGLEEALEESYSEYLQRRGQREEMIKEKRKRLGMDGELDEGEQEGEGEGQEEEHDFDDHLQVLDDDDEEEAGGGLLVKLDEGRAGVAKSGATMAAQWFKQDLFEDANIEQDGAEEDAPPKKKSKKTDQSKIEKPEQSLEQRASFEDEEEEEGVAKAGLGGHLSGKGKDSFEIVPLSKKKEDSGSETDSEDEYDLLDDQGKAEVLALAKRMLRRKEKESIIDAAYSRYASHDVGLPRWFEEDELKHRRPILPVTKDEVAEEKTRLKAIDARPIKRIAEAKQRAKKRLSARLNSAREKAEAISNQEDVPHASKMKEIDKVYAKARSVGVKKGKGARSGGPKKKIDGRDKQQMTREKRMQKKNFGRSGGKKAASGGKGGRGGKGGGRGGKR